MDITTLAQLDFQLNHCLSSSTYAIPPDIIFDPYFKQFDSFIVTEKIYEQLMTEFLTYSFKNRNVELLFNERCPRPGLIDLAHNFSTKKAWTLLEFSQNTYSDEKPFRGIFDKFMVFGNLKKITCEDLFADEVYKNHIDRVKDEKIIRYYVKLMCKNLPIRDNDFLINEINTRFNLYDDHIKKYLTGLAIKRLIPAKILNHFYKPAFNESFIPERKDKPYFKHPIKIKQIDKKFEVYSQKPTIKLLIQIEAGLNLNEFIEIKNNGKIIKKIIYNGFAINSEIELPTYLSYEMNVNALIYHIS